MFGSLPARQVADEPEEPGKAKGPSAPSSVVSDAASDVAGGAEVAPLPPDAPPDRLSMPKLGKTDSF